MILTCRIAIAVICLFCSVGTMVVLGIAITVMMTGVVLLTVAVVTYLKAKRNKESKSIHAVKNHSSISNKVFSPNLLNLFPFCKLKILKILNE